MRISGVPVGKVKAIELDEQTAARDATIELEAKYAPIPKDTQAILRQKTLLGETYVELTPGDKAQRQRCPRAARCRRRRSRRRSSSTRSSARSTRRRARPSRPGCSRRRSASTAAGSDINDALGNLAPFAEDTTDAAADPQLARRPRSAGWSRNTGDVFDALTRARRPARALIANSNRVFATTAARDHELAGDLPRRCRPSSTSRATTLDAPDARSRSNTNPLVTQLRPAARELSPDAAGASRRSRPTSRRSSATSTR